MLPRAILRSGFALPLDAYYFLIMDSALSNHCLSLDCYQPNRFEYFHAGRNTNDTKKSADFERVNILPYRVILLQEKYIDINILPDGVILEIEKIKLFLMWSVYCQMRPFY